MAINFCSITTIPHKWRCQIRDEMSWDNGGMSSTLRYKLPKCRLALNFQKRRLICWAIVSFLTWENDDRPYVGAWTLKGHRRKGYALRTIRALFKHIKFPITQEINVYRDSMYRIVQKIGHNPIFQEWDEKKQEAWFKEIC